MRARASCRSTSCSSRRSEPAKLEQPSFDARTTALANGSQQILAALGLWRDLAGYAEPIRTIHVSERGRFGAARHQGRARRA